MEKKDFERMAGCGLTALEWENARTVYYALPYSHWEELAGEWGELRNTMLMRKCAEHVKWMDQKLRETAVEALGRCPEDADTLSEVFGRQFGVRSVVRLKCREGLPLSAAERDYVARNLI